jgi:hypothetical protein
MSAELHSIAGGAEKTALAMPKHFKKAGLKAAWADLVESVDAKLVTRENRFTLEMAATLLAKFRSGDAMTATESKELKRYMIALGLAKDDDDKGPKKPRKNAHYFDEK